MIAQDADAKVESVLLSTLGKLRQQLKHNDSRIRHTFLRRIGIPTLDYIVLPFDHLRDQLLLIDDLRERFGADKFFSTRRSQTQWHGEKYHLCPKCNDRNSFGLIQCRKCGTGFPANLPILYDELRSYFLLDDGVTDATYQHWADTLFELDRLVTRADVGPVEKHGTAKWWTDFIYRMAIATNFKISLIGALSFGLATDNPLTFEMVAADRFVNSMLPVSSLPAGEHFVYLTEDIRECSIVAIESLLQSGQLSQETNSIRRRPRLEVVEDIAHPFIRFDGDAYPPVSYEMSELFQALIAADGKKIPATKYGIRSRDYRKLPKKLRDLIEADRSGTWIDKKNLWSG